VKPGKSKNGGFPRTIDTVYLRITNRCNCRCLTCVNGGSEDGDPGNELTYREIAVVLDELGGLGLKHFTLWGGEPLLRKESPRVFKHAKKVGLSTTICTNGILLERLADDLVGCVDHFVVSLDAVGPLHDRLRNRKGTFDGAVSAIRAVTDRGASFVKIWTHLNRRNIGEVDRLISLADGLGIVVEFFPTHAETPDMERVVLTDGQKRKVFSRILSKKQSGAPVANSDHFLNHLIKGTTFRCSYPKTAIEINDNGDLYSCERPMGSMCRVWGNIRDHRVSELVTPERLAPFIEDMKDCNYCSIPCIFDTSWEFNHRIRG